MWNWFLHEETTPIGVGAITVALFFGFISLERRIKGVNMRMNGLDARITALEACNYIEEKEKQK